MRLASTISVLSVALSIGLGVTTLDVAPAQPPSTTAFHQAVGDCDVVAISDGSLPLALERLLSGEVPGGLQALIAATYPSRPVDTSITAFLIRTPARFVLVDTGAGEALGANQGGQFQANLRAAGYTAEQVDAILLTHMHGDHAGGLLTGGRIAFPKLEDGDFSASTAKFRPPRLSTASSQPATRRRRGLRAAASSRAPRPSAVAAVCRAAAC